MSQHNEESYEKAIHNAKASMELSGFTITQEHMELVRAKLKGEITEEKFLKKVLEQAKKR
ncbi:antitoxin VbhA family protein [Sutcliffiella sp. NPDC057660]|uniref:antitoxin VbhA family protein n=1 Tax=Sutcliffiella sp. NPDC057660 TaxID=3346199 RepID=UPI0036C4A9BB